MRIRKSGLGGYFAVTSFGNIRLAECTMCGKPVMLPLGTMPIGKRVQLEYELFKMGVRVGGWEENVDGYTCECGECEPEPPLDCEYVYDGEILETTE